MGNCNNCGAESGGKYCPECGQETTVKRLEVKTIFHDITHGILHWENSILKTFRALLTSPGITASNYISGMRKAYVKPFSYFIFIQTVYVLVFHSLSDKYFVFMNYTINAQESMKGEIEHLQHAVNAYINYFNYFMPVFFALYFFLFFKKKTGVNYAESMALSFYWVGTSLVFGIALMLLSLIDIRIWSLRFIITPVYLIFATLQFSKTPKFRDITKGILTVFAGYITYVLFIAIILFAYFYMGTRGFRPQ